MKVIVIVASLVAFFVMGFIVSFRGLDLRKRSSWLIGAFSFLCGFAMGILLSGNRIEGLKVGTAFAFLILVGGATMRWHNQRYGGKARILFSRYEKEESPSVFVKLVMKLLEKYR